MGKNVARLAVMFGLGFIVGVAIDAAKNQDECHDCLLVEDERKKQSAEVKQECQTCQPEPKRYEYASSAPTHQAAKRYKQKRSSMKPRYNNAAYPTQKPEANLSETAEKMKSWGFDKELVEKMFPAVQKSPAAKEAFLNCLKEICKEKDEGNKPNLDPRTSILS